MFLHPLPIPKYVFDIWYIIYYYIPHIVLHTFARVGCAYVFRAVKQSKEVSQMSAKAAIRAYDDYVAGNGVFSLSGSSELVAGERNYRPRDDIEKEALHRQRVEKRKMSEAAKEQDALSVVRYVVTKILGWSAQDAMEHMTPDLVRATHIDMLMKYILFPPYIPKDDFRWVIHKAFYTQTQYNEDEQLYEIYRRVLSGELQRFPKNLFDGEDGLYRLGLLLKMYISQNIPVNSVRDLYDMFHDPTAGWKILTKAKLFNVTRPLYDTPLDALHDALGAEGVPFFYNYYQCIAVFDAVETEMHRTARKACSAT